MTWENASGPVANDLDALRKDIDSIDAKIMDLLNLRVGVSLKIGRNKSKSGLKIVDKEREVKIFQNVIFRAQLFPAKPAMKIFRIIMAESKRIQQLGKQIF